MRSDVKRAAIMVVKVAVRRANQSPLKGRYQTCTGRQGGLLPEASPVFDAMADGRSRPGGWSTGRRTFGRRP